MDRENLTPMLRQYLEIKKQHKEYVLFYRLGDFYEMFYEEAELMAETLSLTLTARAGVPMCGVPYHSAFTYIKKLVNAGYKVAICEQLEAPGGKGPVKREVVRLITPGTLIEENLLDSDDNNYIGCFYADNSSGICGMVFGDLSTGEINSVEVSGEAEIINELSRYNPSEILFNADFADYKAAAEYLKTRLNCTGEILDEKEFVLSTDAFSGKPVSSAEKRAYSALLGYVKKTQKTEDERFLTLNAHKAEEYMELGTNTRFHLELTQTMRGREKRGSLLWVLDGTRTVMGRRRLKQFIDRPLKNHLAIKNRLDAVEELTRNSPALIALREAFGGIYDLERLLTRVVYKTATPKEVKALGLTCAKIPGIKQKLAGLSSQLARELNAKADSLTDITDLIEMSVADDPPSHTKETGFIKNGVNIELDRLRELSKGGREQLDAIEKREREATHIKNLRVGYNRVFGYYIEVSKGNVGNVPAHYHRKQTLVNGERYITEELKKLEEEILAANENALALETSIFNDVKNFIKDRMEKIQDAAEAVSVLDVLCSFADTAIKEDYKRPEITLESVIDIKGGRHPVVEKMLTDGVFSPNDAYLDNAGSRLLLITGPNMSGKSTYMRQVALITLMAQIGSFVPAASARLGVSDKLFTRVGASDDLSMGQSTFMVEMLEVAEILKTATPQSLVILDEIGRGTSTFDGISIAKAVAEHINEKIKCKTLFATHYHELIALEKPQNGIRNYSVMVSKKGGEIAFLHKIIEGGTDDSYGIEVAKLAGLPDRVITGAKKALKQMELNSKIELESELREKEDNREQFDFTHLARENAIHRLKALDLDNMTPMEALRELIELKREL